MITNIYTDGGARGNPGPAAIGVHIEDENKKTLGEIGQRIGIATNNVAEYSAVLAGLTWLLENKEKIKIDKANFYLDSNLVCSQINGLYKIKNPELRKLIFIVREKEAELKLTIEYSYIRREQNVKADRLVNMALDNKI
jgi:ribonuclease HI